jgi:hypothetical protein
MFAMLKVDVVDSRRPFNDARMKSLLSHKTMQKEKIDYLNFMKS